MGNNSGGCVGSGGGVGVGVHDAGMLAGGAVECVVVCRGLECSLEELHRSWFFQEISHKTCVTSRWNILNDAASAGIIIV